MTRSHSSANVGPAKYASKLDSPKGTPSKADTIDQRKISQSILQNEMQIKNRVKYLERAQEKVVTKMTKMQAAMDDREKAMKQKESERMRQALRHVRDEAIRNQKSTMIADIKKVNLEAKIKQEDEQ